MFTQSADVNTGIQRGYFPYCKTGASRSLANIMIPVVPVIDLLVNAPLGSGRVYCQASDQHIRFSTRPGKRAYHPRLLPPYIPTISAAP